MFFQSKLENLPPLLSSALSISELSCEVKILVIDYDNSMFKLFKEYNVTVKKLTKTSPQNILVKILDRLKIIIEYLREINSLKPVVIWFHKSHYISFNAFLPRVAGIKSVSHMHEIDAQV